MNTHQRAALFGAPLLLAITLAGCTSPGAGPGSMPGMDHGSALPSATVSGATMADQMFVTMMIPHHRQAIEMAELVLAEDDVDPRVADLAERIQAAQGPEIERMEGWLEEWGIAYDPDADDGMDHGDGMMSEADMTALADADGPAAGRLFLEQMVLHHEGAVEMAEVALSQAEHPDVLALAQQVIDDQTAEIAEMQALAAEL